MVNTSFTQTSRFFQRRFWGWVWGNAHKADGTSVGRTGYLAGGPTVWIAKAQEILDAAQKIEK
jgi:hypothetical protein